MLFLFAEVGDVRLAGGVTSDVSGAQYGRLEVFSNGGWGAVCDRRGDRFDPNRAAAFFSDASVAVACRQLGFSAGIKISVFVCIPLELCSACSCAAAHDILKAPLTIITAKLLLGVESLRKAAVTAGIAQPPAGAAE